MQTSQVFSQRTWPAAGDLDDCWVVATIWCANAVAPWLFLQNTTAFRKAAGDPDDGQTDGGRLKEIMQACRALWPQLGVERYADEPWAGLMRRLDAGRPASVAVLSEALPPRLQFGFRGLHQVALFVDHEGKLRIMNPLQKDRARPEHIGEDAAREAARAYGGGSVYAAVFPTEASAFRTHPLYLAPGPAPEPPPPADCKVEVTTALDEAIAAIEAIKPPIG